MNEKIRVEINLRGTEKEIEDMKAFIATLTIFEEVISLHMKKI